MLFSLSNTLASFQEYINKILAEKLDIFIIMYLDNILIYIEDLGQPYINVVRWVLEQFQRHGLFTNLKKCYFYQNKICFLKFVVSVQSINIEGKKIEIIKTWPELMSIRDIQVFLKFTNFYWRFIQEFSKIVVLFTLILKASTTSTETPPKATDNSTFLTPETKLVFLQLR